MQEENYKQSYTKKKPKVNYLSTNSLFKKKKKTQKRERERVE